MRGQGNETDHLDLASIRAKLEKEGGKRFWQSLDELAETENYRELLHHEFAHDIRKEPYLLSRRSVLKLMAASAATTEKMLSSSLEKAYGLLRQST